MQILLVALRGDQAVKLCHLLTEEEDELMHVREDDFEDSTLLYIRVEYNSYYCTKLLLEKGLI